VSSFTRWRQPSVATTRTWTVSSPSSTSSSSPWCSVWSSSGDRATRTLADWSWAAPLALFRVCCVVGWIWGRSGRLYLWCTYCCVFLYLRAEELLRIPVWCELTATRADAILSVSAPNLHIIHVLWFKLLIKPRYALIGSYFPFPITTQRDGQRPRKEACGVLRYEWLECGQKLCGLRN